MLAVPVCLGGIPAFAQDLRLDTQGVGFDRGRPPDAPQERSKRSPSRGQPMAQGAPGPELALLGARAGDSGGVLPVGRDLASDVVVAGSRGPSGLSRATATSGFRSSLRATSRLAPRFPDGA